MIIDQRSKNFNTERIAALCGLIWFVFTMDACFTWFFTWPVRNFIGAIFVVYATFTLKLTANIVVSNHRVALFVTLGVLLLYLIFSSGHIVAPIAKYLPLLCVIFWSRHVLCIFYRYVRNFILFYAILSIGVEIIFVTGLIHYIPYYTMAAQGNVQELNGTVNHVYLGIFSIPSYQFLLPYYRTLGPLREAGHFSIFLGFVYFIEKAVYGRRNLWILICGLMTLSPNFPVFFIVTELYASFSTRRIFKPFLVLTFLSVFIVGAYIILPQSVKDEIYRVVLERSLEESLSEANTTGLMAILNGRVNDVGMTLYSQFQNEASLEERLFGYHLMNDYVLSDFRYLVIRFGYVGLAFFFFSTILFAKCQKYFLYGLSVFFIAFVVFLQRAWMFEHAYIWTMMLLAVNTKLSNDNLNLMKRK